MFAEPLPFQNRTVLATSSSEEARTMVGRFLKHHDLQLLERDDRQADTRMHRLPLRDVSVFFLQYGASVLVDPGPLDTFHIVHINLAGQCDVTFPDGEVTVAGRRAIVCSPSRPVRFRWSPDSQVLGIKVGKQALENHYQQITGLPLQRPIDFDVDLDLDSSQGRRWTALLNYIQEDAALPCGLCTTPAGVAQLEQLVIATLLLSQPGSHYDLVNRPASPASPRYVKRAEAFMRANLHRPLALEEIAAHTGVSPRSLINGFRDFRGASPMAYFTNLRLERAHEDLLAQKRETTVSAVAHNWGFQHLSSFASLYRRRYGAAPGETLRRGTCLS